MDHKKQIIAVLKDFIEGADQVDIQRLGSALHAHFLNIQNGYFDQTGVFSIDKTSYIDHVSSGKFGGVARKLEIKDIDIMGDMAMMKVELTSPYLQFYSYLSLVYENNEWKVIGNFPKVKVISPVQTN